MYLPLFNGQAIFGTAIRLRRGVGERALQKNAFPGLSGLESLDMGGRGRVTNVTGRFKCATEEDLNAAILIFESYKDGNAYVLRDQFGNNWPYVLLEEFTPTGELNNIFSIGGYTVQYSAKFEHLI
jgi:hypothetical protein